MSEYSTQYISRARAIEHIKEIAEKNVVIVTSDNFLDKLNLSQTEKPGLFTQKEYQDLITNVENYPNEILGNILDNKIFSFYSCENYIVTDDGEEY